jgi:hypothetical protein
MVPINAKALSFAKVNRIINRRKQLYKQLGDRTNAQYYCALSYQLKHDMSLGFVAIMMRRPDYYVSGRI